MEFYDNFVSKVSFNPPWTQQSEQVSKINVPITISTTATTTKFNALPTPPASPTKSIVITYSFFSLTFIPLSIIHSN